MSAHEKSHAVKDPQVRQLWSLDHHVCWACGWTSVMGIVSGTLRWLETHHIIKQGRSDEFCNFCRLCQTCHRLAENEKVPDPLGGYWPTLTLANILWLKCKNDPSNYNPERLMALWHRKSLPDPEPIPERFMEERIRNNATPWSPHARQPKAVSSQPFGYSGGCERGACETGSQGPEAETCPET